MRLAMLLFLGLVLGGALVYLRMTPQSYAAQDRTALPGEVGRLHPAGTDELGRDRAVRVCAALVLGLGGAAAASLIASSLALLLGGAAAAGPAWISRMLLYGGDLFLTLPWIFLLMLVRAALPLNLPAAETGTITFLILGLLGAPAFLRVNHQRTSALLGAGWLLQSHAAGLRRSQLIRQVLPHVRPIFWTQFLLYVPACIIAEANLGTLGLGLAEPLPSWGNMLAGLQSAVMVSSSRLVFLPLAVLVVVLVALELTIFGVRLEE